ncbi:MAG: glycosyltransferase [Rhodospirillales bacterium]|nr:glycosyltransferase [Rhodospirillales bacterium]
MKNILIAAAIASALHAGGWFLARESTDAATASNIIESMSYTAGPPETLGQPMDERNRERIARDLSIMAGYTSAVRLYGAGGMNADIPEIAAQNGLAVVAGAWISADAKLNESEVEAIIRMANRHSNVRSVIVGNETILREELQTDELIAQIRAVRRKVKKAVSTGETWDIWLKHPELVREVDFIAAHILPYWEGIKAKEAVEYALGRYEALRAAYPGKRVVVAEFGWPSRGYNLRDADTGPLLQAEIIRNFVSAAAERDIAFNIIEAFDQPWKTREGSVGAYWGILTADGKPKFPLEGTVQESMFFQHLALALSIGALITVGGFFWLRPTFLHALAVAIAANTLSAGVAMAAMYPVENYLNVGSSIAWVLGFLLMIPLTAMTLVKVNEVAEVTLGRQPTRLVRPPVITPDATGSTFPKVSIHIPAYRENPEMLKETLDAVARLDYPDFEVLVVINNTPDEALWRPVEAHCAELGPRFRFINLPKVSGFKAGALNLAMEFMAPDAEIIALLDADYVVSKDWLKDLVPVFADPKVALVQAPQDHRDGEENAFKKVMNAEYAGFFDIGMVQRNENDAAIAHGTMLLIRRSAFDEVGRWQTDTITEDTELGLRLFEAGYSAQYTNRRYGWGMLPDTFQAFKTQRHRWAVGAMQIIRKHWRHMLPRSGTLTGMQKIQFINGWSYWMFDAFGVLAAYMNLFWVPMILLVGVLIPMLPFTLPILVAFAVNLMHCIMLYGVRVRIPASRIAGAAIAAMSLQMTVAKAIAEGLWGVKIGFKRTEKGGLVKSGAGRFPARAELIAALALATGATALIVFNETETLEINIFAATLYVQSTPFFAAVIVALMERFSTPRRAPSA